MRSAAYVIIDRTFICFRCLYADTEGEILHLDFCSHFLGI